MKQKILTLARKIKRTCVPPKPSLTEIRLSELTASCQAYLEQNNIKPTLKILWPTLFNQDHTWWAHDGILTWALRLRGADIIPTMCDKLQSTQCMIYSGVWQGSFEPGFEERRKNICAQCVNHDLRLWEILNIRPIRLSSYLTEGERDAIWQEVRTLMQDDWENAVFEGYPIGREVFKAVVNNHLQGEIKPYWREQANEMAVSHAFNVIALKRAYERIFTTIAPERIVGNGGYYYQWGVVHELAQQNQIPYYRYFPVGLQPMAWNYALNSKHLIDVNPAWDSWIKQPWGEKEQLRVKNDLKARGLYVSLAQEPDIAERVEQLRAKLNLDKSKRTLLAFTGVIWDANTNIQSDVYQNMYLWLLDTIDWFTHHPQVQLIIRVHPAEDAVPSIDPQNRSRFEKELAEKGITLPSNVFLIKQHEKVETYDLMHLSDVGTVYMSTTGLEFSCLGKPLIAIGPVHYTNKGFTLEPKSRFDYQEMLAQHLVNKQLFKAPEEIQLLAMKYWYLYAFHASCVTGLFETQQKNWLAIKRGIDGFSFHPKALTAQDLLPGANEQIDYFCDAVMNSLPIMGENRWPPEFKEMS